MTPQWIHGGDNHALVLDAAARLYLSAFMHAQLRYSDALTLHMASILEVVSILADAIVPPSLGRAYRGSWRL